MPGAVLSAGPGWEHHILVTLCDEDTVFFSVFHLWKQMETGEFGQHVQGYKAGKWYESGFEPK